MQGKNIDEIKAELDVKNVNSEDLGLDLVFIYKPKMKAKHKNRLRVIASEAMMSMGEKSNDQEKFDMFKNGLKDAVEAFGNLSSMIKAQEEGSQRVFDELAKVHWNSEQFVKTGGKQGDVWQNFDIGNIDADVYDQLIEPLKDYNILGVKKN